MNTDRQKKEPALRKSWFYRDILNNRVATSLLSILLVLLIMYMLTTMSELFRPVKIAAGIIGPPLLVATLFYYLLNPIVRQLERRGLSTPIAVGIVFVVIIALLIGAGYYIAPIVREQYDRFLRNMPYYYSTGLAQIDEMIENPWLKQLVAQLEKTEWVTNTSAKLDQLLALTVGSIGNVVGVVTTFLITILTAPFLLYYMFIDGRQLKRFIVKAFPTRWRGGADYFMREAHRQVGSYIRGQLLVAIVVGIMFYIGYTIIGLDYALLLAIISGVLNMVPYLGSIISAVPALILGAFVSPMMFVKAALVLMLEQTIEGRFVSPIILGNSLEIHPVIILFILLVGGGIFGVVGVLLAVPGYALLRILVTMFFQWLQEHTDLYPNHSGPVPPRD